MSEHTPMSTCPMAGACTRMMHRRSSGFAAALPGLILIAVGILIVVEPRILAWVIAAVFIALGAGMLMMARFIRRLNRTFW